MREGITWYDLSEFTIEGRGFEDLLSPYDRLPSNARKKVSDIIWNLSLDSAGICARFLSDTSALFVRWDLRKRSLEMPHMPATGVSGIDLYVKNGKSWRWLAIGQPTSNENEVLLFEKVESVTREYLLYLPLYNGVQSVSLGIPASTKQIFPAKKRNGSIVFYGTSITHGACASRPGTCHVALLGRWLNRPVINLGFSGNGKMEPEIGIIIADIKTDLFVIDCLPNMNAKLVMERLPDFCRILRSKQLHTPILLVEDRTYADAFFCTDRAKVNQSNRAALGRAYSVLKREGIDNVHYLQGNNLLGIDGEDTVDGSHPTDLGFLRQAKVFFPAIQEILLRQE